MLIAQTRNIWDQLFCLSDQMWPSGMSKGLYYRAILKPFSEPNLIFNLLKTQTEKTETSVTTTPQRSTVPTLQQHSRTEGQRSPKYWLNQTAAKINLKLKKHYISVFPLFVGLSVRSACILMAGKDK